MASAPSSVPAATVHTDPAARSYERAAGIAAIVTGIGGLIYSVAFLGGVVAGFARELGIVVRRWRSCWAAS